MTRVTFKGLLERYSDLGVLGKEGCSLKPQGGMRIKRGISGSFMENKNKLIHN